MNAKYTAKKPVPEEASLSPQAIVAALILTGLISTLVADMVSQQELRIALLSYSILCYFAALAALLVHRSRPTVGRWLLSFALILTVTGGLFGLHSTAFLAMLALPIIAAMMLVGISGAIAATGVLSSILATATHFGMVGQDHLIVQVALWLILLLLLVSFVTVRDKSRWSLFYYQRAQVMLAESRDRSAHLEQVLQELMQANRQLDLLNERLAVTRLQAEEAHKAKAAFVAKVSHEFRTPLNMITGLIDLLMETPEVYGDSLPPALVEDLSIVHRNCLHLSSIVNDVLDISQTEGGRLSLHREWVDLRDEIEAAVEIVQPLVDKKKVILQVRVPDTLQDVYCDRTRIRQVILNLISNAARYTERGAITVEAVCNSRTVSVSVADTGPGIPFEDLDRIFEPFHQRTDGAWRDRSGSGLGLTISRQFVELHGGQIRVESTIGRGSEFVFDLPVAPAAIASASPARWISEDWMWLERPELPKIPEYPYHQRIVVCDETSDGDTNRLFGEPHETVEVVRTGDLQEAIAIAEECPAHAFVVSMDVPKRMWATLDEVRHRIPDTPIIGYLVPRAIERAWELGAIKHLIKPITRGDLTEVIETLEHPPNRVLVADDDEVFRRMLGRMLRAHNPTLEVQFASEGKEVLELLRTSPPDLVFLDIVMPDYDGWYALEQKERDPSIRDIPVALVSAQDTVESLPDRGMLVSTIGEGIPIGKMMQCALDLADLLLQPERALHPTPSETQGAVPA